MKRSIQKNNLLRMAGSLVMALLSSAGAEMVCAGTITLTDLNLGDAMSISSLNNTANGVTVTETYGEKTLIPYSSLVPLYPDSGDQAIVTASGTYFDKVVTYTGFNSGDLFEFEFQILNDTAACYDWRDYHFEIWNDDFTARQQAPWASPNPNSGNLPTLASDQFTGLVIHPNVATFHSFAGSGERHEYGVVGTYTLRMELYSFNNTSDGSFGLRQVATTAVPEPGSMAIFGLGVSLVVAARRKRVQSKLGDSALAI
jgi:PEP-CTERM motif